MRGLPLTSIVFPSDVLNKRFNVTDFISVLLVGYIGSMETGCNPGVFLAVIATVKPVDGVKDSPCDV